MYIDEDKGWKMKKSWETPKLIVLYVKETKGSKNNFVLESNLLNSNNGDSSYSGQNS